MINQRIIIGKVINSNLDESDNEKKREREMIEDNHKKFLAKVTRLQNCLDRLAVKFSNNEEENPRILLVRLKNETDMKEKNKILDKLENIIITAMRTYNLSSAK
jgi:hypothetical protein